MDEPPRAQLVVDRLLIVGARAGLEWGRAFRTRGTVDVWTIAPGVRAKQPSRASMTLAPCGSSSVTPARASWMRSPAITIVACGSTAASPVREGWMIVAPLMTVTGAGAASAAPGSASSAA